jgi:hypothetical protein
MRQQRTRSQTVPPGKGGHVLKNRPRSVRLLETAFTKETRWQPTGSSPSSIAPISRALPAVRQTVWKSATTRLRSCASLRGVAPRAG